MNDKTIAVVSLDGIEHCIFLIRGQKVMLDIDLAILYEVPVKRLKEQVKRNRDRFPEDFIFKLSLQETALLFSSRSQNAALKRGHNTKYGSYVFTEQGVAMLSGILHSARAIEVHVAIMRAFVNMRQILSGSREFGEKLKELENKLIAHDYRIEDIVKVIRKLMAEPRKTNPKIGF